MKIWYYVNDKKTGIRIARYDTLEEARKHASKNKNYFVSLRWDFIKQKTKGRTAEK